MGYPKGQLVTVEGEKRENTIHIFLVSLELGLGLNSVGFLKD